MDLRIDLHSGGGVCRDRIVAEFETGLIMMTQLQRLLALPLLSLMMAVLAPAQQLPEASPASVGMSASQLARIDEAVNIEIANKQLPGAVVEVGRKGKIVWRRAYGNRALEPQVEPMTLNTIFDMASLT